MTFLSLISEFPFLAKPVAKEKIKNINICMMDKITHQVNEENIGPRGPV